MTGKPSLNGNRQLRAKVAIGREALNLTLVSLVAILVFIGQFQMALASCDAGAAESLKSALPRWESSAHSAPKKSKNG
mgnify:CR=1 FL=1